MPVMKSLCAGVLLALVALVSSAGAADFTLHKRSAEAVDFESLVGGGRWTLVMLWQIDCIPCEQQKPMIDSFHVSHVDATARVIGVALDGLAKVDGINAVIARTPTRFPNFVAEPDAFYADYRVRTGQDFRATPTYLLFDPNGQYVANHVGVIDRDALEKVVAGS